MISLDGVERALDVGTGTGSFAIALAGHVSSVVGVDLVAEMLAEARRRSPANVTYLLADATALPFPADAFELACAGRVLHHAQRPGRVLAELARVTQLCGHVVVIDQLAPERLAAGRALNRFERARDASTTTVLTDSELRRLGESAALTLRHVEVVEEQRELEHYLDLAGCTGVARERARALAPRSDTVEIGWYVFAVSG